MDARQIDERQFAVNVEEMRAAPRFSLLLRIAKLIGKDGEYVCVVRDVSESGAKLRLFHDAPPDEFLLLELGNGTVYPIQSVWRRDGHAGFRFASAINVSEFIEEPGELSRRPIRLSLARTGKLTAEGQSFNVSLVNISQHGLCLESPLDLAVGQRVKIEVRGVPARIGNVCWRRNQHHGVVCQQAFRLDELAMIMFALQPYSPGAELGAEPSADQTGMKVAYCA